MDFPPPLNWVDGLDGEVGVLYQTILEILSSPQALKRHPY